MEGAPSASAELGAPSRGPDRLVTLEGVTRFSGMSTCEVAEPVNRSAEASTGFVLPFEEVYRLHSQAVYRFCLSQVRNADEAEDATADVFVAAYSAYSRVRPPAEELKFWLLRIARNTVISRWRRRARRERIEALLGGRASHAEDVYEVATVREDLRAVVAGIAQLRQRDRTLIGLRAAALSYAEVGALLRMSEGAARVATHRALRALSQVVRGHDA
jgi:RNA polymerase sigma-70 factor, ECF subfamily